MFEIHLTGDSDMGTYVDFIYSGFWDRPLGFVVNYHGVQLFFSREFNEQADDYETEYRVYLLPTIAVSEVQESWQDLRQKAEAYVCSLPMGNIRFDSTFRKSIQTDVLDDVIALLRTP